MLLFFQFETTLYAPVSNRASILIPKRQGIEHAQGSALHPFDFFRTMLPVCTVWNRSWRSLCEKLFERAQKSGANSPRGFRAGVITLAEASGNEEGTADGVGGKRGEAVQGEQSGDGDYIRKCTFFMEGIQQSSSGGKREVHSMSWSVAEHSQC